MLTPCAGRRLRWPSRRPHVALKGPSGVPTGIHSPPPTLKGCRKKPAARGRNVPLRVAGLKWMYWQVRTVGLFCLLFSCTGLIILVDHEFSATSHQRSPRVDGKKIAAALSAAAAAATAAAAAARICVRITQRTQLSSYTPTAFGARGIILAQTLGARVLLGSRSSSVDTPGVSFAAERTRFIQYKKHKTSRRFYWGTAPQGICVV